MLELNKISYKEYKEACKKFREDTKEWGALDSSKQYVSNGNEWVETCDNGIGGLDISWCFGIENCAFRCRVRNEYIRKIKDNVNAIVENDCVDDWNKEEIKQYLNWILEALKL